MPHKTTKSHHESHADRAAATKHAAEEQQAAHAKAAALADAVPEGGPADLPLAHKGEPMPSASHAHDLGASEEATSTATVGKDEKEAAHRAGLAKGEHGRGHRKAEDA